MASTRVKTVSRDSRMSASIRASWGSTIVAAFVSMTVTVCWPSASMISLARRSPIRGARFLSRFPIRRRPAWRRASGVGQVRSRSSTAGWSSRGPRTRSRAGWIWVSRPRIRFDVAVACFGQIVVEAAENGQFSELFVGDLDGSQCVGHGPGRVGNDERVPGVGFRLARVQVSYPAHRQPGQVSNGDTVGLCDRDRQRTNRGRLVNHEQDAAVLVQ